MFRFFKKKEVDNFTMDERQELIKDYLYKADRLANNFQYDRAPYYRGGIEQLDQFIADLKVISDRVHALETVEMYEKRTEFEKILDKSE